MARRASRRRESAGTTIEGQSLVACASGNLVLLYLTCLDGRLDRDEIGRRYPELIPGLVAHPGVALVVVDTTDVGPVALGRAGQHELATGRVVGEDPAGRVRSPGGAEPATPGGLLECRRSHRHRAVRRRDRRGRVVRGPRGIPRRARRVADGTLPAASRRPDAARTRHSSARLPSTTSSGDGRDLPPSVARPATSPRRRRRAPGTTARDTQTRCRS